MERGRLVKGHWGMKNSTVMSSLGFLLVSNLSVGTEEANNTRTGTELCKTKEEKKKAV